MTTDNITWPTDPTIIHQGNPLAPVAARFVIDGVPGDTVIAPVGKSLAVQVGAVKPATQPPDPEPPVGAHGKYGDGWPTIPDSAKPVTLRVGGNNNIDFGAASIVDGVTFDGAGANYAVKLTDCKGTLYLRNCTFKNCRQGLAVSNPGKQAHAPTVHIIESNFEDCYAHEVPVDGRQPMAQVAVYYHDPLPRDGKEPTLGMYGNRFINSGIGGHDPATRAKFARQFHHVAYCKGNANIVAFDNLCVNYSGQGIKAIGKSADLQRNAFLMGAVGFNFGQDSGQQDKTGRWQMDCTAYDNLVYGMGDLQADNQRLGWGCVLESCDVFMGGNIFANPVGVGNRTPAYRCNRVRDYGVKVRFHLEPNVIVGHTHAFEVQGDGIEWGPEVIGPRDSTTLANPVSPFASRNGGTIDDTDWDYEYATVAAIRLDIPAIEAKARARTITAADVLADARRQIGGG